jgi:hypothetical protein
VARAKHLAKPSGRPVIAQYTDVDADSFTVMPDGRRMERTVFGLTEDQVGRIRAGYTCLKCLEDHVAPFPDNCAVCKFPMRDRQTEEFAKDFRGNIRFGPSTTLDEEYEIAEERIQRDAHNRARELGLILPKWY